MSNRMHCLSLSACSAPLGMQDGRIKDSQLGASSSYRELLNIYRGRLYSTMPDGSWTAGSNAIGEYFQIDLLQMHAISKVATQGRHSSGYNQWVTRYYLKYSIDDVSWETYMYRGTVQVIL